MFILPSLSDTLAAGREPKGLILLSALWCRQCAGSSDSGAAIAPNDPNWGRLAAVAQAARAKPAHWLAMDDIHGAAGRDPAVIAGFTRAVHALWERGTVDVLTDFPHGQPGPAQPRRIPPVLRGFQPVLASPCPCRKVCLGGRGLPKGGVAG